MKEKYMKGNSGGGNGSDGLSGKPTIKDGNYGDSGKPGKKPPHQPFSNAPGKNPGHGGRGSDKPPYQKV